MKRIYLNICWEKIDKWICIIQCVERKYSLKPSKLTQLSAKKIFRLMSGITDQLFYPKDCCNNCQSCKICKFVRKYYNVNFNLKPLDFVKVSNIFFENAISIFKEYNINYDGRDPMLNLDEKIFFN